MSTSSQNLKKLVTLASAGAGCLTVFNHYINASAVHKNQLHPETGSYYNWKLGRIYYQKEGKGSKTLLLIHDAAEWSSGYEWTLLTGKLRKEYTIYTIDLLGCGRSDKPGVMYTNYLYVQMISAFIRDIVGGPVHVATSGRSAAFAVMTAKCEPSLISEIIMINPTPLKKLADVPDNRSLFIKKLLSLPLIGTTIYNITVSHSNMDYLLDEKLFYNPFKVQKRACSAFYESAHRGHGFGRFILASRLGKYMNWDIRRALSEIDQPVTLLFSEKKDGSREAAENYRKYNPDIVLYSIPSARNLPQMEVPERILPYLLAF